MSEMPPSTPSASSPAFSDPTHSEQTVDSDTSFSDVHLDTEEQICLDFRVQALQYRLSELFNETILVKILRTASSSLEEPGKFDKENGNLLGFPEIVPQEGPNAGQYEFRDPEFWTCGFFPGSLYALLERSTKYAQCLATGTAKVDKVRTHLRSLCITWASPLYSMATRTDTHDIGFIIMPALKRDWELTGNETSLHAIVQAAISLATRYIPTARAIRSWDSLIKKNITVTDMITNLLVIIDSLCNLDLLFYASAQTGDASLAAIAAAHAHTLLRTHLRPESHIPVPKHGYQGQLYSTCHVANLDPDSGELKYRCTAQGYSNESTWARGQAWAILGYAQTYMWTKDPIFLDAACGVAEYFLYRLDSAPSCVEIESDTPNKRKGRYVPLWDFDAPVDPTAPLRDSSAGVIAANGLLVLSQALTGLNRDLLARRFLDGAIAIVGDTMDLCLAPDGARFVGDGTVLTIEDYERGRSFEGILRNGTANNNQYARRRYANHGLVYGDYYLIEFGNRLLEMGLI